MPERAFPVVYARDVERSGRFYQRLGFEAHFRLPPQGDAGYVGLRPGGDELAVTTIDSPEQLIGVQDGSGPRFEMFVYVDNVDATLAALRGGDVWLLKGRQGMFWGERVAWIADPDGKSCRPRHHHRHRISPNSRILNSYTGECESMASPARHRRSSSRRAQRPTGSVPESGGEDRGRFQA